MNPSRRRDQTPLYLIGAMCLMWALLHTVLGTSFFGLAAGAVAPAGGRAAPGAGDL